MSSPVPIIPLHIPFVTRRTRAYFAPVIAQLVNQLSLIRDLAVNGKATHHLLHG